MESPDNNHDRSSSIKPDEKSSNGESNIDKKAIWTIGVVFIIFFLLLTPLGLFSKAIPSDWHTGYYSIAKMDSADDTGYYSYLRSAFFDGDIDFFNEQNFYYRNKISPTGYSHNHWAVGSAILWFPFFIMGHLVALTYKWLGYAVQADGYSFPYIVITGIGSMLYVLCGLYLCYRLLRKFFSPFASLLSTIGVFLSTPLPYYTFIQPHLSHSGEFFLVVLFITIFFHWRENGKKPLHCFFLGAVSGMLFNIRNNSFTFFSIFIVDLLLRRLFEKKQASGAFEERSPWSIGKPIGAGFFFTAFPQFIAWHTIFGKFFPPTELYGSFFSNLIDPQVIFFGIPKLFFSPDWGLALTQPIWLLGTAGLFLHIRRDAILSALFLTALFLSLSVSAAYNSIFVSQFSFGYRMLVSCNFLISFGLATFLDYFKRVSKIFWLSLTVLFVFMNYLLIISFQIAVKWNNPEFALNTYLKIPWFICEAPYLFIRSTGIFRLIPIGSKLLSDFYGWFFVFFLPLGFIAVVIISTRLFLGKFLRSLTERKPASYALVVFFLMLVGLDLLSVKLHHRKKHDDILNRLEEGIVGCLINANTDMAIQNLETAKSLGMNQQALDKWQGSIHTAKIWKLLDRKRGALNSLCIPIIQNINLLYFALYVDNKPFEANVALIFGDFRNSLYLYLGPMKKGIIITGLIDWKLEG